MTLLITIAIILMAILVLYNNLVKANNKVKQAASGIDVYLTQRFDLIPNLVECVKAYSKHEESIFTEIANLRSLYMSQSKNLEKGANLNNKMKRDNFTEKDLQEIAAALDCTFTISFKLNDTGEEV